MFIITITITITITVDFDSDDPYVPEPSLALDRNFAAGLQGQGKHKRSVFSQTSISQSLP